MAREKILELDCLGDICPVPLIRLQKALKSIDTDQFIKIITDHSCAQRSVSDYCSRFNLSMTTEEVISGVWEITVTRN